MKLVFFPFFAAMNIKEARKYFNEKCATLFDESERDGIFMRIAEHLTGLTTLQIKTNKELEISSIGFEEIVAQLASDKPIQYILGYEWFYEMKLKVNEHVLIPRPETDELVRWIIEVVKTSSVQIQSVIDIGTGSGCIPIVLKKCLPHLRISALDISKDALNVAIENAQTYRLDIDFVEGDILNEDISLQKSYDLIVSNPPYITIAEKNEMHPRVLAFEPHQALFVNNNDALQFYKTIALFALKYLTKQGYVFLELNNLFANEITQLFTQHGFQTTLKKDMYGNERMLMSQKK